MHWQGRLAALFVVLALTGCAPAAVGPGQTPNAPYQQADPRDTGLAPVKWSLVVDEPPRLGSNSTARAGIRPEGRYYSGGKRGERQPSTTRRST